jgi:uncharacterized protein (DUF433 family)
MYTWKRLWCGNQSVGGPEGSASYADSSAALEKDRCDMTREQLLERISIDPNVCFGKPCIRGRRIWVSLILDLLASGMKMEQVMQEYNLVEEDILACIAYGAEMARERYVDIPTRTAT